MADIFISYSRSDREKAKQIAEALISVVLLIFASLIIASAIIADGVGIGYILNWLLPSTDFGMASLADVVELIPSI